MSSSLDRNSQSPLSPAVADALNKSAEITKFILNASKAGTGIQKLDSLWQRIHNDNGGDAEPEELAPYSLPVSSPLSNHLKSCVGPSHSPRSASSQQRNPDPDPSVSSQRMAFLDTSPQTLANSPAVTEPLDLSYLREDLTSFRPRNQAKVSAVGLPPSRGTPREFLQDDSHTIRSPARADQRLSARRHGETERGEEPSQSFDKFSGEDSAQHNARNRLPAEAEQAATPRQPVKAADFSVLGSPQERQNSRALAPTPAPPPTLPQLDALDPCKRVIITGTFGVGLQVS